MLALLCRSVAPQMSLADAIKDWGCLRRKMAEPPRKRTLQREEVWNFFG
jgi:hypothetical protein